MSTCKRFKRDLPALETLPNELLFEVLSYLTGVDAVLAFARLNKRFQCLILHYCTTFDFKSISKTKFDYIIRNHSIRRWRSLRLCDDDNTPGQTTYFCRLFSFSKYIAQLETLSILSTKCDTTLLSLRQLTSFKHLVSLSIGSVCGKTIPLVELLSLKHLVITSCLHSNWMKKLQLDSLQYTIEHHCNHEHNLTLPTTLKQLKVFITRSGDTEILRGSLTHLSQLLHLTIYDGAWESSPPNGQIWEELITSSIPLLKNFQFCFKFWRDFSSTSDINRIVSTFSTSFYLQEKSWFVQCDAHQQQFSVATLYSLPYAFNRFDIVTHSFDDSISTAKTYPRTNSYEHVKQLKIDVPCEKMDPTLISLKIVDITLKHYNSSIEWIFSITQLKQITLGHRINMSPKEFVRLLKDFLHLTSLIVSYQTLEAVTNEWRNKLVCKLLSQKIRSLKIASSDCPSAHVHDYTKVEELVHIVRVFGEHCRHLTITVYSRNIVAGLILRAMRQLRSLKVLLKEHNDDLKITQKWLINQNAIFKHLDYYITVDGNEYSFWFSRHHRR